MPSFPAASSTTRTRGLWNAITARTFLGRMANDSDLKGAIVFLASDGLGLRDRAGLAVDGGYLAK